MNTLSNDQQYAFNKFVNGENLFVTGPGGTGKTELIKHIVNYAKSENSNIQVCALTGCAACLLNCEARTVHSFFGIGLAKGENMKIVSQSIAKKHIRKDIQRTKILIIDEVSMMSLKIFEIIEEICRKSKNMLHKPFGGIQVLFTGDFFQLPPVSSMGDPDTEKFCFESLLWNSVFKKENQIELTTMFRQKDPIYSSILLDIRKGYLSEEHFEILKTCMNRNTIDQNGVETIIPTKLFAIKSKADHVNNTMFSKINEEAKVFTKDILLDCTNYIEGGNPIPSNILTKCSKMTVKEKQFEIDNLINNIPGLKEDLQLKKGTLVMCTRNLDLDKGICNGSQGIVVDFIENGLKRIPIVKFTNGIRMPINIYYWQSEECPTIAVGQIPLILAWAITIHKIQGATLSMAEMDVGRSIFEYGQIYVALSRVKSLDGLYLLGFHPTKIRANPKVLEFYRGLIPVSQMNVYNVEKKTIELKEDNYVPETNIETKEIKINFNNYKYNENSHTIVCKRL
jgi:ATP-dependent DNA helicase PIF1